MAADLASSWAYYLTKSTIDGTRKVLDFVDPPADVVPLAQFVAPQHS